MRGWTAALVPGAIVATIAAASTAPQNPPAQTFRTTTDLVTVDVTVRAGGAPVAGLTAADFVLLDNGVRQTIDSVSMDEVPVEVTVLVDNNEDVADHVEGMQSQLAKFAALLRPTDRFRVTTIGPQVTDVVLATSPARAELPARLAAAGVSSAYDGLISALLRRIEPNRPHLIFALTNGIDAISSVDGTAIREIARQSQATLYIVQVDVALLGPSIPLTYTSGRQRVDSHRCQVAMLCSPTRRFWIPFEQRDFDMLREVAESTGGALYLPGVFTDRSASAIFRKVFDDYRRSYLLRYTPQGIAREGWHDLTVTIPKYPGYAVHARRGYAVDPTKPSPGRTPPVDDIDVLAAAFDRDERDFGDRLRGTADLARTIDRLQDEPTRWPANPQRESAFVIELTHAALLSGRVVDREAGRQLLTRHHALVRHPLGPDAFERFWLWAAIAVLQASRDPAVAQPLVDRALTRFPDEPRFLLARAFLADQRRFRSSRTGPPAEEVLALYDAAAAHPDARAEAQLRKAWLLHRLGRDADALDLLDRADDSPDDTLRYLRQICRGEVLGTLQRPAEAAAAFRAALALAPDAQSPKVELMTALLRQGDLAGAQRLAADIETGRGDAVDPAWVYWLGDYRSFADIVRRLRDQTR